ncbi:MAG: hypothetical protein GEU74_08265 [Nitriliruptorales bacterium]|nr:hypothetical protein [Nitriliruptorales bacterium]
MVLIVVTVAAGVIAGWVRGGRVRHIASASIRGGALVVAAALAQAVHAVAPQPQVAVAMTGLSQVALLAFLWLNRFAAGALLVAMGSSLNAAVILANGAMPVSRDAIIAVSRRPYEVMGRHRLLQPGDAFPWLADVTGLPLLRTVVSVGDVVLAAGAGMLVMWLMRPPRRPATSAADPVDGFRQTLP